VDTKWHFEWDENKNRKNQKKHSVSFEEATEVFFDPMQRGILDVRYDDGEERWITIGSTKKDRILVVGHLYNISVNGTETIRIITARTATRKERDQYENSKS